MGSIRSRDGKLFLDFHYQQVRCREQTKLTDTPANRQKLAKVLAMLQARQFAAGQVKVNLSYV